MIEFKNVTKIYESEKGVKVVALNNVSLKFANKGLVFILGKSGSGKSTLLNLLGGLDKCDNGEIIIDGKNTMSFKQQNFDFYRNTYIGFIFQEFNILNEYNIYNNIELSLQLQNQKNNKDKINAVLSQLGLNGMENRKVSELSGGQKQRVAIARALIKDPAIILADEPTGNLDSLTGEQVFEILKKISNNKLVIIVSHNEEAANRYADRIVRLNDGNVISDTYITDIVPDYSLNLKPFKKSKLPFLQSLKFGLSGMRKRKIRLFLTMILLTFALTFLGISYALSNIDINHAHAKLMVENDEQLIIMRKNYSNGVGNYSRAYFTDYDIRNLNIKCKNMKIRQIDNGFSYFDFGVNEPNFLSYYYTIGSNSLKFVELDNEEDMIDKNIIGRFPKSNDEILIPKIFADYIIRLGITIRSKTADNKIIDKLYKPTSYEQIIKDSESINFKEIKNVKISGIINDDLNNFDIIKDATYASNIEYYQSLADANLSTELYDLTNIYFNKIYVKNGFLKDLNLSRSNMLNEGRAEIIFNNKNIGLLNLSYVNKEIEIYDGKEYKKINKLDDNQIVLDINNLDMMINNDYNDSLSKYLENNPEIDYKEATKKFFEKFVNSNNILNKTISLKLQNPSMNVQTKSIEIIGIISGSYQMDADNSVVYTSQNNIDKYIRERIITEEIYLYENDIKEMASIFKKYPLSGVIESETKFSSSMKEATNLFKFIGRITSYACIAFLIFSIMFLVNFILSTIGGRKKEIGILRALGARMKDILLIFVWEGLIISIISFVLYIISILIITKILNVYISGEIIKVPITTIFSPISFSAEQFGIIAIIILIIMFISSIIPIYKISKMKPIDAIYEK